MYESFFNYFVIPLTVCYICVAQLKFQRWILLSTISPEIEIEIDRERERERETEIERHCSTLEFSKHFYSM